MFGSRVLTTRRTALAIAASTPFLLSACDLDAARDQTLPTPTAEVDADLVASARRAIDDVITFLTAVSLQHRPLRAEVASLLAMHAAHLEALDDGSESEAESSSQPVLPSSGLPQARAQIRTREATLAETLADAARRADSGDLGRALASMAAAGAQRVQV